MTGNAYPYKRAITVLCLILLLCAGCTTASSLQRAQWKKDAAQPITCKKGPDCDAKWSRAFKWVQDNADSSINIANETIITTDTPIVWSSPIFSITKTEAEPGTYIINFRASCAWLLGCEPSILELKASFANYVMKSTDVPSETKTQGTKRITIMRPKANLGVVTVKTTQAAAARLGMKEPAGTRIIHIGSDGAALDAGLRVDDVILTFGTEPVHDDEGLESALERITPPATVPLTIWRQGVGEITISVSF